VYSGGQAVQRDSKATRRNGRGVGAARPEPNFKQLGWPSLWSMDTLQSSHFSSPPPPATHNRFASVPGTRPPYGTAFKKAPLSLVPARCALFLTKLPLSHLDRARPQESPRSIKTCPKTALLKSYFSFYKYLYDSFCQGIHMHIIYIHIYISLSTSHTAPCIHAYISVATYNLQTWTPKL